MENFIKRRQFDEIDKFNTKQIGNLKSLVAIKEIEFIIFKLPPKNSEQR